MSRIPERELKGIYSALICVTYTLRIPERELKEGSQVNILRALYGIPERELKGLLSPLSGSLVRTNPGKGVESLMCAILENSPMF